ncbi:MAG: hypothetical protein U0Y10_20315 [Spirosomataceae bacterium]
MNSTTQKPLIDQKRIHHTIYLLHNRIEARFPESGLGKVCEKLLHISEETSKTIEWVEKPNYLIRILFGLFLAFMVGILIVSVQSLDIDFNHLQLVDLVQTIEAATNEIVLIGAGVFFLYSYENRMKRDKIIACVNELRSIIHLIDLHQLTKDPYVYKNLSEFKNSTFSPKREMSLLELNRYLDYCTEMLSLTSKIGFLYVQNFNDETCTATVNELESLSVSLSRKIWQKISFLK